MSLIWNWSSSRTCNTMEGHPFWFTWSRYPLDGGRMGIYSSQYNDGTRCIVELWWAITLCFSNIGEFDKLAKHLEAYGPAHHTEVNVSATTLYFAQVANLYNATALLFPIGTSGRQGLGLAQWMVQSYKTTLQKWTRTYGKTSEEHLKPEATQTWPLSKLLEDQEQKERRRRKTVIRWSFLMVWEHLWNSGGSS